MPSDEVISARFRPLNKLALNDLDDEEPDDESDSSETDDEL